MFQQSEIEQLIINEIDTLQPYIASHGGRIDFVKYEHSIVYVKLEGACQQCPLSFYTLTYGIERQLKSKFSGISKVAIIE
ncbi:NifU family protein [Candidatus Dependentiae bacterium]|nr:NifU family protein [Candidatus Dependentiae bacterium]